MFDFEKKALEQHQWRCYDVVFGNFEQILHITLMFISLSDFEQVNTGCVGFEKRLNYSSDECLRFEFF